MKKRKNASLTLKGDTLEALDELNKALRVGDLRSLYWALKTGSDLAQMARKGGKIWIQPPPPMRPFRIAILPGERLVDDDKEYRRDFCEQCGYTCVCKEWHTVEGEPCVVCGKERGSV